MRWRFPLGLSPAEAAARAAKLDDIDAWWAALAEAWPTIRASFRNEGAFDVAAFVQEHLGERVHPAIMWEFGPHAGGGDFLALCPEARRELAPLVDATLARAPAFDGLHVRRGRPPNSVEGARAIVQARTGGELPPFVRVDALAEHGLVALTWQLAPGARVDRGAEERALVATEAVLGEEVLDRWIGPIDVEAAPSVGWFDRLRGRAPPPPAAPVETLAARVDAAVAGLRAALPDAPYAAAGPEGEETLFRVQPPGPPSRARRGDVFLVRSRAPRVSEATFRAASFDSARHSRHGELFAYVKLARDPADAGREVEARARYEDALADALAPAGLGAVIGGAMGGGYAYVDLALARPDDALPIIRSTLRALDAPREAWVLFFDAALAEEWVGAWDDGPPPPADESH